MANLVELFDNIVQMQNLNGVPLAAGKLYVYALGRTRLMDTWSDIDGESLNPNPIILDDAGQAHVYVSDDFDYTLVVCDQFDNEIFSVDKYLLSEGSHNHADVAVAPSEHIGVSSYHVGEVTVYVPYLTGEVGKVYEGIDPIVVNNDVNRISANHIPLGVQDPLYFVEDSETACIIGCSAQTEIPTALSGKWDEASDAVIANSAQWAEGTEYEAGSYIDITNNTISVVNLPTSADVQNIVDVATSGLMPSGDYLTKESADTLYAPTGNYLTGLPDDLVYSADITGLATTAQLDEKLDKTAFSTVSGDFLTAIPSEYITENTLQSGLSSKLDSTAFSTVSGDFLTAHQSLDGLMSADLLEISDNKITGYNGTAFAGQGGTANPQIPVTGINGIKISESGDKVVFEVSADYALNSALQNVSAEITGMIPAPFDPTYLSGQIDTKLDSAIYAEDSGKFLTAHQSLAGYATENWVTSQGYLTAETDWSDTITAASANAYNEATAAIPTGLATEDWVTAQGYLTAHQSLEDYQTTADMVNYQTTAGMTAYQEAGSYLSANALDSISGDWNEVSAKLDTTAFSDVSGSFLTAVPDTYLQNTDLATSDGKVTAISGIPLSAGGDVPEGVMVESGLEYNAVNEISAYNGSAIAQYGAEKQFIVHDDTLVHLSNSAQYALGVNLSAVAQLLGVDETVLWSGDINENNLTGTLSEPISSFNKVKILTKINRSTPDAKQWFEFDTDREYYTILGGLTDNSDTSAGGPFHGLVMVSLTGGNVKYVNGYQHMWGVTGFDHKMFASIYKVVGIGRKQ